MNNTNIGRRRFTIGAVAGIGAVAVGISSPIELISQIGSYDKNKGAFSLEPNIWLEIRRDNTIIITIPRSELGQGVRTSLSMITAEELDADWNLIKAINAQGDKKYGSQGTGGSTSIRVFWDTLRMAGAQARIMLVSAAASIWGIPSSSCRTENSYVYEIGGSRKSSYGELIDKAGEMPIPDAAGIKLKQPDEFKIIGKTKWHIDNPEIVTGKAIYSSDFRTDGMKYAVVKRSPDIGGTLIKFNDDKAKIVSGYLQSFPINEGLAVVAENSYAAIQAADKIEVEWKPGPISNISSKDISKKMMELMGSLPELPNSTDKEIESIYEVPLLAHATMEPMNSFANFKDGKCEIWTMTQNPQTARSTVAKALDISEDDVTVNVLLSGGGFGRGHRNDFVGMAAQISQKAGFPIKFFYTKEDDIKNDYYRPFSIHKIKSGVDANGNITGWIHKVASQGTVKATDPQYDIINIQNLHDSHDFSIPTGPWRSVNNTQANFANESMIDELSLLAGADPLEFRLKMTKEPRLKKVIEYVADKSDWKKPLPKNWGRGVSSFVGYGGFSAHVVEVSVTNSGVLKVERVVAALDCGIAINPGNIEAQFMGSAIDALAVALKSEITIKNGQIEQSGFHDYEWISMRESTKIEVYIMPSNESPGGIGELGFPSVAPALCNAIYDACGIRVRKLPLKHTTLEHNL
ncbi:MAG: xanthine dehydrogenase family protein molybdopterin-binding subunit [Candidatus Kapabacteria bacterium]|nr:xanthine dehydrogenase family protein molybdopterin-binding subunit [Ignavibacteriota bacterium]MCW5884222.1 xanthine dehydrogenase family protein molybdopterin-binding subunit [Candidatus Kapabacteria bacterium]